MIELIILCVKVIIAIAIALVLIGLALYLMARIFGFIAEHGRTIIKNICTFTLVLFVVGVIAAAPFYL